MVGNDLVVTGSTEMSRKQWRVPAISGCGTHPLPARWPELLGLFPGEVTDSWRAKRSLSAARLGIRAAAGPAGIRMTVFVHVDSGYRDLVDDPGDTLVHRLNLYENAVRYIRGGSTPWLADGRFGPYVPPLDDPAAHAGRTATLERLLERSRYIATRGQRSLTHLRPGRGRYPGHGPGHVEPGVNRPSVLVVRPRPSRPLGAFYRNLGLTMLATHLRASGMEPLLADLTFDSYHAALETGARTAAFSLYIDDFAEGARLAMTAREAGLVAGRGAARTQPCSARTC